LFYPNLPQYLKTGLKCKKIKDIINTDKKFLYHVSSTLFEFSSSELLVLVYGPLDSYSKKFWKRIEAAISALFDFSLKNFTVTISA